MTPQELQNPLDELEVVEIVTFLDRDGPWDGYFFVGLALFGLQEVVEAWLFTPASNIGAGSMVRARVPTAALRRVWRRTQV